MMSKDKGQTIIREIDLQSTISYESHYLHVTHPIYAPYWFPDNSRRFRFACHKPLHCDDRSSGMPPLK